MTLARLVGLLVSTALIAVVGGAVGVFVGFFAGGIIGTVVAIVTGDDQWGYDLSEAGAIAGAVIAGLAALAHLISGIRAGEESRRREGRVAVATQERAQADLERAARALQASLRHQMERAANEAVLAFETLPGLIRAGCDHCTQAEQLLAVRSNTPFWEAVETALATLATYRSMVESIAMNAHVYASAADDPRLDPPAPEPFPVSLDHVLALESAAVVERRIRTLVASAHRVDGYSQVYEQRRTTEAVEFGFANLGAAINGMGAALLSAVSSLQSEVTATSSSVEAAVLRVAATQDELGLAADRRAADDRTVGRQLTSRVDACATELHRLRTW